MRPRDLRCWAVATALAAAAVAAAALKPSQPLADTRAPVDLETLLPARFGQWQAGTSAATPPRPAAEQANRFYGQVVARTYVDRENRPVMLSIAYGRNELGDELQAHRPESCYAAQGFAVRPLRDETLATGTHAVPVRRLFAQRGARSEPVTYWITVGDRAARPGLERKLAQLRTGLRGTIPDGVLVRVSTLDDDPGAGFALQDRFIRDLLSTLAPEARARLAGNY